MVRREKESGALFSESELCTSFTLDFPFKWNLPGDPTGQWDSYNKGGGGLLPPVSLHYSSVTSKEFFEGKRLLPNSISYFRGTFHFPFCPYAVDKLAPHPLLFICITKEVYCTGEADLFHKLLCVSPQKKGFEIREHEALGLAFFPQPALSLHNRITLTAPM